MRKKKKRLFPLLLMAIGGVLVVGGVVVTLSAKAYLRSDAFRLLAGEQVGRLLQAKGEFSTLHWNTNSLFADRFRAHGEADSMVKTLETDQIRADIALGKLVSGVWQIDDVTVGKAKIDFNKNTASGLENAVPLLACDPTSNWITRWLPDQVNVGVIKIEEADVVWGMAGSGLYNSRLRLTPEDQSLRLAATRGEVVLGDRFPELKVASITARYRTAELYFSDARFLIGDTGRLSTSGVLCFTPKKSSRLDVEFSDIPVAALLSGEWSRYLQGRLGGDVTVVGQVNRLEEWVVDGLVKADAATLQGLPLLTQIARYTRTPSYEHLQLQRLEGQVHHVGERTAVTEFVMESEGLIRIEGEFVLDAQAVSGTFQVGVSPQSLRWLLGATTQVFTEKRDGYHWTTVHLSGTQDHLQEDLSARLIAAFPIGVVEEVLKPVPATVGTVIDVTSGVTNAVMPTTRGESATVETIEGAANAATGVVHDVGHGVLNLLLPSPRPQPTPTK